MRILILGASYGSLLSTKLLMAGHDVTLVCLPEEAALINAEGTIVRIKLRGEDTPRVIRSGDQTGTLNAVTPDAADPAAYDLVALAMQEPQYGAAEVKALLARVAQAGVPCLSIMNMPPLAYLRRIPGLDADALSGCFTDPSVWAPFDPGLVTLCSPDPQAFRPPEEPLNVLQVGLPTNFKAAAFADAKHSQMLQTLEADIAAVRLDSHDVPVKLRMHDSLFVPMAKWAMLVAGNYRCVTADGARPIREAVHSDLATSRVIYEWVADLVVAVGAERGDLVPFEKYAKAAEGLLKPSSAARAINAGAPRIERVDKLVQLIARSKGESLAALDKIVDTVDARLAANAG